VLILKGVKVVCFDTLLQVLILKEMEDVSAIGEMRDEMGARHPHTPGVLQKESGSY
jgi:hypothetical protein